MSMSAKLRYDADSDIAWLEGELKPLLKRSTFKAYLRMENGTVEPDGAVAFPTTKATLHQRYEELLDFLTDEGIELVATGEVGDEVHRVQADQRDFQDFSATAAGIWWGEVDALELEAFAKVVAERLPGRTLYPLQLLSAFHLAFSRNACNFSVPGAGKTTVVLAAYAYMSSLPPDHPEHVDHLLVVGPLSSFKAWKDEFEEGFKRKPAMKRLAGFTPMHERRTYLQNFCGEASCTEVTATNYETAASCEEDLIRFLGAKERTVMMVLDEAHRIKREDGTHAAAVLRIAPFANSRVVLTGTPAPNGYEDLRNLFKFIYPFRDVVGFQTSALKAMTDGQMHGAIDALKRNIQPFYTRIRKRDLGLEEPEPRDEPVQMRELHQQIYRGVERIIVPQLRNSDASASSSLVRARLVRLRQAAVNPSLLLQPLEAEGLFDVAGGAFSTSELEIAESVSQFRPEQHLERLKKLDDILQKTIASQGKVVVWSYFLGNLALLSDFFKEHADFVSVLSGGTPVRESENHDFWEEQSQQDAETREAIIERFHNTDETSIIFANPQAVGESISLHKVARTAVYFDRDFNAGRFIQSKDRIHRYSPNPLGKVRYFFLMGEGTIDDAISRRLIEKEERLSDLVDSQEIPLFGLLDDEESATDIQAILYDYERRKKV